MIPDTPVFDHRDDIGLVIDEQFHSDEAMHRLNWVNTNNPDLTVKERILRDLKFRKRAIELRYPIPYSQRYLEYLKYVDRDLFLMLD